MVEPVFDAPDREEWDEADWERFLQRSDARTAKYQELFETLAHHPQRNRLIAHEMGWEDDLTDCGGGENCPGCARRFDCEAYEMFRLMTDPASIEEDPDAAELIACFEQLREIPAYAQAQRFATRVEMVLRDRMPGRIEDEDVRSLLFSSQMVPSQIAGGHGIGYDRDSLCGNIANCKRALRSLAGCREGLGRLAARGLMRRSDADALRAQAVHVAACVDEWIASLRARVWWR